MKIITIIFISFLSSLTMQAKEIQLLSENWPPYQIKIDGFTTGLSIDIVKQIQKKIGHTSKIKFYPWNRSYNMTLKKDGYALFSMTRTSTREKLFKWVGPITDYQIAFYKLSSNKKEYKTLEDARNASSVGVSKNDVLEQELTHLEFKNLNIKVGGSSMKNLKRLLKGEIELLPSGYYSGNYRIKNLGVTQKVVPTKIPFIVQSKLSIAFNINTPDEVIEKWQKALDEIKADGTYENILNKYK